jgi:hypothetical protein
LASAAVAALAGVVVFLAACWWWAGDALNDVVNVNRRVRTGRFVAPGV